VEVQIRFYKKIYLKSLSKIKELLYWKGKKIFTAWRCTIPYYLDFFTFGSVLILIPFQHKSLFYGQELSEKAFQVAQEKGIGREKSLKWVFSKIAVKACQELTTLAVFQTLFVQVHYTFSKK
jgi:hypothetical protein